MLHCFLSMSKLSNTTLQAGLVRENVMNGYLLLMQFEKLDMSSFISSVVGWPHRPRLMPHSNNTTENEYSHAVTLST